MTESEALKNINEFGIRLGAGDYIDLEALRIAEKALEEIQEYRAIGAVEECREAREKQKAKKYKKIHPCKSVNYYQCPCCNGLLHMNENFCGDCGQAISWEDEECLT